MQAPLEKAGDAIISLNALRLPSSAGTLCTVTDRFGLSQLPTRMPSAGIASALHTSSTTALLVADVVVAVAAAIVSYSSSVSGDQDSPLQ
jgi:hypothetical protein